MLIVKKEYVNNPQSHRFFTARSKRKLLGRKDSFEGRPNDLGMQTLAGTSRASSQNDSFMALLRRTRSAKATPGGRISATELLKSSKPTASSQAYDAIRP